MQKTYKCKSCGVCFLAEEAPVVVCPHCQSDDIEAEKQGNPMKKIIIIAACAFVLALGVGMLIGFLKKDRTTSGAFEDTGFNTGVENTYTREPKASGSSDSKESTPSVADDDFDFDATGVTTDEDVEIDFEETAPEAETNPLILAEIEMTELIERKANGTYSFAVAVTGVPSDAKVVYELTTIPGGNIVKRNGNGNFSGVPASPNGKYMLNVKITCRQWKSDLSRELSGFDKKVTETILPEKNETQAEKSQPKPQLQIEPLTTAEMQAIINSVVASRSTKALTTNPKIAKGLKVEFEPIDGESPVPGMSTILSLVKMEIVAGYTVVNVRYDSQNKVNYILLRGK